MRLVEVDGAFGGTVAFHASDFVRAVDTGDGTTELVLRQPDGRVWEIVVRTDAAEIAHACCSSLNWRKRGWLERCVANMNSMFTTDNPQIEAIPSLCPVCKGISCDSGATRETCRACGGRGVML